MDKKKEKLIMIGAVVLLFVAVIGISYAAFNYSRKGSKVNTITTGAIAMSYEESSNVITLDKALPTTDATGKVQLKAGEYFDFTVSSTIQGTANINFEIAAEDDASNTISGSNIKYYLTKIKEDGTEEEVMAPRVYHEEVAANEYTGRPANMMSLYAGSMNASTTTKYRLRLYVTEEYNPQGDGGGLIYKTRVNVYGKTGGKTATGPVMKSNANKVWDAINSERYYSITQVVTKSDTMVPETAVKSFDASEAGDNSVIAYLENIGTNGTEAYKLTIGANGGIIAPSDLSYLFCEFWHVEAMDLSNLDTSNVTNMSDMFYDCGGLTSLDLSSFDTSNVTDMSDMFYGCGGLTSLDLSSFDTSKVTNMRHMFYNCDSLTSLDLTNFNTMSVTNMGAMFSGCTNLTSLDLINYDLEINNFDTSNVTDMSSMFDGCWGLTSLDLSSFDTSKVTDMSYMFSACSNLTDLDLSSFDTSSVTNMSSMFGECGCLTTLDLTSFDTSKVIDMSYMFWNTQELYRISVSDLFQIAETAEGMFESSMCNELTYV